MSDKPKITLDDIAEVKRKFDDNDWNIAKDIVWDSVREQLYAAAKEHELDLMLFGTAITRTFITGNGDIKMDSIHMDEFLRSRKMKLKNKYRNKEFSDLLSALYYVTNEAEDMQAVVCDLINVLFNKGMLNDSDIEQITSMEVLDD